MTKKEIYYNLCEKHLANKQRDEIVEMAMQEYAEHWMIMYEGAELRRKELEKPLREFLAYYETDFIKVTAKDGRVLAALISSMWKALGKV